MEEYTTMRKIVRVRSLCAVKWSRRWKVARPCLQTVKRWARGTGRGESRGVQKPAGFYGLRTAVYIVHCPVLRRRATPKNPLHQLSTGANLEL